MENFKRKYGKNQDIPINVPLDSKFVRYVGNIFYKLTSEEKYYTKELCHILEGVLGISKTEQYKDPYLTNEYNNNIDILCKRPMYEVMDFIYEATVIYFDGLPIDDINYYFEDYNIDFRLKNDRENPWVYSGDNEIYTNIEAIQKSISEICIQTSSHIEQAKKNLENKEDLRARKDAIRDCLSAMESLLRNITGESTIDKANSLMLKKGIEPKFIVTDGHRLWKHFHEDIQDIRHGNPEISDISLEEAFYYCDRILSYINYIALISKRKDFPFEK